MVIGKRRVEQKSDIRHLRIGLTDEVLLEMYRTMVLSRAVDDRAWLLTRQGKAAFAISGHGHEAAQVASAYALRRGYDYFLPYYRDTAVVLALGMTPREILLGVLAKAEDPCSGGRQMPSHWSYPALNIFTTGSPVATQVPHAAGVALASKLRREDRVTAVYFGDGATSEGDFHEGLNFIALHRLPVILVCENNGYAISVPARKQSAVPSVAQRASAYSIPGVAVDGCDPLDVYLATYEAAERARSGEGPSLIEARTVRLAPHSSNDDHKSYRPADELESCAAEDPIIKFRDYLLATGVLTQHQDDAMRGGIEAEVDEATDYADQAPLPRPEDALRHVYAS